MARRRSLFGLGVDLRPLFVPRWAKGYETGPSFFDLTLDSLSLSLGAFWARAAAHAPRQQHAVSKLASALALPLFATAAGPWLEARGALRYPDGGRAKKRVFIALAWHGFVLTPLSAQPRAQACSRRLTQAAAPGLGLTLLIAPCFTNTSAASARPLYSLAIVNE